MPLLAGFAETDITPPLGTAKIGWLKQLNIQRILDPLFARAMVLGSDSGDTGDTGDTGGALGIITVDLLSIRWTTAMQIRAGIARRTGFNPQAILISATHNHGGPAIANVGDVRRDGTYVATLVDRCVEVFVRAHEQRRPAQIGTGSCPEFRVAFNRRVVMRDGTTKTHGRFADPNALYLEGPIDPEVGVIAVRDTQGRPLGMLINFACHPTHHGGGEECTAGWPGRLAHEMKTGGWPVPLFLQGAAGETHTSDPITGHDMEMETAGRLITEDALHVIDAMKFRATPSALGARTRTLQLPYRLASPEEVNGTIRGAQRFIDPAIYDRAMPALLERIRTRGTQPAEVQALRLDDLAILSVPGEFFVRLGLRIKEQAYPRRAWIAAYANGMVGYIPDHVAFARGGYETTFAPSSRLAPEAGDILGDAALALIRESFGGFTLPRGS